MANRLELRPAVLSAFGSRIASNFGNPRKASGLPSCVNQRRCSRPLFTASSRLPGASVGLPDGSYRRSLRGADPAAIYSVQFDSRSALVFRKHGEDLFLRRLQTYGSSVWMPVSRQEKFEKRAANERRRPKKALVRVMVQ